MNKVLRALARDASATTAIEYGLILALVALGIMIGLNALAGENTRIWQTIEGETTSAMTRPAP